QRGNARVREMGGDLRAHDTRTENRHRTDHGSSLSTVSPLGESCAVQHSPRGHPAVGWACANVPRVHPAVALALATGRVSWESYAAVSRGNPMPFSSSGPVKPSWNSRNVSAAPRRWLSVSSESRPRTD